MTNVDLHQLVGQVKAGYGPGIIFTTALFSATTPTGFIYLAWQRALYFTFKLTVAEGGSHMLPVVLFSRWLRVLQDLGIILATSLIFWLQTQSITPPVAPVSYLSQTAGK